MKIIETIKGFIVLAFIFAGHWLHIETSKLVYAPMILPTMVQLKKGKF